MKNNELMSFEELNELFNTAEKLAECKKKHLSLDELNSKLEEEKQIMAIKRQVKKNRYEISDPETIGTILDHVVMTPDYEISAALGEACTPFPTLDTETEFSFADEASLIDSMTVAAWDSMRSNGGRYGKYRFARSFWEMLFGMVKHNDWFMLLHYVTVDGLVSCLKAKADGKRDIPAFLPNSDSYSESLNSPPGYFPKEITTIGELMRMLDDRFTGWDPGKCRLEKYGEFVLVGCWAMMSLIRAIVAGYFDIDKRIEFYKSHYHTQLRQLFEEERSSYGQSARQAG